jgi:murein DD-endopeptidase MepM/ murein hydrolase activator NlpD
MGKKWDILKRKLTNKYRLVIMNEDTYEELLDFKLSRLNVYVVGGVFSILLILLTSLVISYTPLREYVPGYASTEVKERSAVLMDSLEILAKINEENVIQLQAIKNVLSGNINITDFHVNKDSLLKANRDTIKPSELLASKDDSVFRAEVESQDRYNVIPSQDTKNTLVLFAPVKGTITSTYEARSQHYGIDIAVPKNTPIKSVEDGTVIFSEWSVDTGFVIIIDHGNSLLSVYKHNASLLKKEGEKVKSGEIIATAGSEGQLSTATHLHFELWYNGYPIDPTQFIAFES